MVRYSVSHGFGNQLFHYWMARMIADRLGFKLEFEKYYFDYRRRPFTLSSLGIPLHLPGKEAPQPFQQVEHKAGVLFDFNKIDPSRAVRVNHDGYSTFEWYPYFQDYKDTIRKVMRKHVGLVPVEPKTLAIHLRLGDFVKVNDIPCAAFYEKAVAHYEPKKIVIITDEPENPFPQYLAWRYRAEVVSKNTLDDFALLSSCDAIVSSDSTFSWWAAFISEAEVYHVWERFRTQKDLRVDEARYHYMDFEWNTKICLRDGS